MQKISGLANVTAIPFVPSTVIRLSFSPDSVVQLLSLSTKGKKVLVKSLIGRSPIHYLLEPGRHALVLQIAPNGSSDVNVHVHYMVIGPDEQMATCSRFSLHVFPMAV